MTPIDAILDPDNNDAIILMNENGEEIAFEQIALIPIERELYVILKPVQPMEGVGEDEGLVFLIAGNEGEEYLELITDMAIIDAVFEVYDRLVEEEMGQ